MKKIWRNKGEKRRDKFVDDVKDFCASGKRKNYLVIVADPETNAVVAGYKQMISGFWNRDTKHTIKEMFSFRPQMSLETAPGEKEAKLILRDEDIDSERNRSIKQFLFEIDGLIDAFGKKIYELSEGEKEAKRLAKQKKVMFGKMYQNQSNVDLAGLKKIDLEAEVKKVREQQEVK